MSLCGILVREKDRRIFKKNMKKKTNKKKKKSLILVLVGAFGIDHA